MHSGRETSISIPNSADDVFQAALGVAQREKKLRILAAHNQARRLILREGSWWTNPKIIHVRVTEQDETTRLRIWVKNDPRVRSAVLDGKHNQQTLMRFRENVRYAADGREPAPATIEANHYLHMGLKVQWDDADEDPQIQLNRETRISFDH